ncbi:MAG: hypothetical protein CL798_02090 [Chromatiales bacterium]|nr:hypothetical protein [Chromatiales bacterium]
MPAGRSIQRETEPFSIRKATTNMAYFNAESGITGQIQFNQASNFIVSPRPVLSHFQAPFDLELSILTGHHGNRWQICL